MLFLLYGPFTNNAGFPDYNQAAHAHLLCNHVLSLPSPFSSPVKNLTNSLVSDCSFVIPRYSCISESTSDEGGEYLCLIDFLPSDKSGISFVVVSSFSYSNTTVTFIKMYPLQLEVTISL